MKQIINISIITIIIVLFSACSKEPLSPQFKSMPKTYLQKGTFEQLKEWNLENYDEALASFNNSCKTKKSRNIYGELCEKASVSHNAKQFFENQFTPYKIINKDSKKESLLTGYYEPELKGSLIESDKYKYPLYNTPSDLIIVNLNSIYPELKKYRLRGKIVGNRLLPYDSRDEINNKNLKAKPICYVDSKIDRFFLEIQGSGRISLENGKTIFVGYDNQNGHKYRAIGRYLIKIGALESKNVSLQSIKKWLEENPSRVDEVLNYNKSLVYFKERKKSASGSLGIVLTPKRSVAVDRSFIPLGTMLYLESQVQENKLNRIVIAEDTGGAIKGAVRADLFLGYGDEAMKIAGRLKSTLSLWILVPNSMENN